MDPGHGGYRFLFPLLLAVVAGSHSPSLQADVVDFESLADLESVTNQFSAQGVTFQNTLALRTLAAGGSLNEIDFPPFSGVTVVADDGGPMSILFSFGLASVSGYFTYNQPIIMSAYDAGSGLLGSVSSNGACAIGNFGSLGDPSCSPNQLLSLNGIGEIALVTISGDAAGGSFVLDNLAFERSGEVVIPEPDTRSLTVAVLVLVAWIARRKLRTISHT